MAFNHLKSRLIFYFLIIIIITSIGITSLAIIKTGQSMIEQNNNNFRKIAQELSFDINNILSEAKANIQFLSNDPILISDDISDDEKAGELQNLKDIWGKYEDIIITDKAGNVIIATDYLYAGDWKYQPVFQKAISGELSTSNVRFITHPLRMTMAFAIPIYHDDAISGVAALQLNTEKISTIINHLKIGKTGFAFLIDEDDRIIAHPSERLLLEKADPQIISQIDQGKEMIEFAESGTEYIGNFFRIKQEIIEDKEWVVVVAQSKKELLEPINMLIINISLITIILVFLTVIVGLYFSNSIVNPIIMLRDASVEVSKGRFHPDLKIDSKDEIGELSSAFNKMTKALHQQRHKLKNYSKDLEKQVKNRTQELQKKNEELERINQVISGRELKMIELKKKIRKYEKKTETPSNL